MLIGAHVNTRGGIDCAVDNGVAIGAEVIQTHPTSAQQWRRLEFSPEVVERYATKYATSGLRGHYLHAIYLINLATPKAEHLQRSVASLVHYMHLAEVLAADGVVFHPGSHLGAGFSSQLPQIHAALRQVLETTSSPARLLIENSAGSGGCVGCRFEEVAEMLEACNDPRLGVCLDTQHLFASGYDIRSRVAVTTTVAEFDDTIGLARLALVHANDSKRPLGAAVDRHDNIGEGEIGEAGFAALCAVPALRAVPWVLEVPGIERRGPDLDQINRLRRLAQLPAATPSEAVPA